MANIIDRIFKFDKRALNKYRAQADKVLAYENEMADLIKQELLKLNIEFIKDSPTNQIFVDVNKELAHNLINEYGCELWEEKEYSTVVRIVTSFNTTVEAVNELLADLRKWVNR